MSYREQLKQFFAKTFRGWYITVTTPKKFLLDCGFPDLPIVIRPSTLNAKIEKHNLSKDDLEQLNTQLNSPLMVFKGKQIGNAFNVVIEKRNEEGFLCCSIHPEYKINKLLVNDIASIHGRRISQLTDWCENKLLIKSNVNKTKKILSDSCLNDSKCEYLISLLDDANVRKGYEINNENTKKLNGGYTMKLTKDNVLEKWGDAKLILQDKKEFIDLAEDSFIPFANLYDEFDEDMKKDFDSFLDTANKLLEEKEKKEEKKKISAREIRTYSDLVKNVKDYQKISERAAKNAQKAGWEVNFAKMAKRYSQAVDNDDFGDMYYVYCYLEECNFHRENELLLAQDWVAINKLIKGESSSAKTEKPKYEKDDWVVIKVKDQNTGKYQEGIPGWVDAIGVENGKTYYKVKITGGKEVFVEDSEIFGKSNKVPNFFIGQVAYIKPASAEVGLIPIKIKSVYCDREGKTFVYRDEKSDTIWSEDQLSHYAPKTEKPKKEPKAKAEKPKKESKKKEEKPTSTATQVEALSPEVKLIKRVITLQGKSIKKANADTKNNPRTILNALQRAILSKQIRKTSKYADEVMYAQDALIRIVNGALSGALSGSDIINFTRYDDLVKVANSEVVSETAKIASQFIKIQEKEGKQKEAENLLKRIDKSGEKGEEIDGMKKSLKNYVEGKTTKLKASEQVLRGLHGIVDVNFESGDVVNSTTIEGKNFDTLDFHGRWEGFFGKPSPDFKFMFYGKPGNGKSTFALQFAGYLSKDLGKSVLYVANEEGFGYTLQEKVKRLNVANSNLYLCDSVPDDLSQFDVVFLDSVNNLGLEPEDLKAMPSGKAYVYVFQTTKDGNYMGKQEFAHDVDTVVRVENMNAYKDKNRYGGEIQEFKVG